MWAFGRLGLMEQAHVRCFVKTEPDVMDEPAVRVSELVREINAAADAFDAAAALQEEIARSMRTRLASLRQSNARLKAALAENRKALVR